MSTNSVSYPLSIRQAMCISSIVNVNIAGEDVSYQSHREISHNLGSIRIREIKCLIWSRMSL